MKVNALIEAGELHAALQSGGCIAVDCRFVLTRREAGFEAYRLEHIPGARYMDLDRDLAAAPGPDDGRHPLPDPAELARTLSALGISNSDHVVAYDDAGGVVAARLWWLLRWIGHERVSILNGGLQAWKAAGFGLEKDAPRHARGNFTAAAPRGDWVVTTAELPAEQAAGHVLIDARSAERFTGRAEPIDPVAGHVPGALNCPNARLLGTDLRLHDVDELRAIFRDELHVAPGTDVIAMCGSGITACHLLLALQRAGIDGGRLYAGSWSEWIRDPARPVASGPAGKSTTLVAE